jgi:hypothetical protein
MTQLTIPTLLLAALLPVQGQDGPRPVDQDAASGQAAAALAIEHMNVELWPEYDDPRVLAIYSGKVAAGVETPTDFSFVVPAGAQIHMAGGLDANGGHLHGLYQTRERDDGLVEVFYRLDVPDFYMEFYYDPFDGGEQRSFDYPVVSPYEIAELVVRVQEPLRAEGFTTSPAASQTMRDQKGFNYHMLRWANVAAETPQSVSVAYRKADRTPSITPQAAEGGAGAPERKTMSNILVFMAVLLVAVVGLGLFFGSQRRAAAKAPVTAPPAPRTPPRDSPPPQRGVSRFCTGCGETVAPADRYCAMCGRPTHTSNVAMATS